MAVDNQYTSGEELARIKKNIATSYIYFEDNYKRFRDFMRYVFSETVTEDQRAMLRRLNRPATEFNILPAYAHRLLGEFAKQEPSVTVSPQADNPVPSEVAKFVENNIRHAIYEANKNSMSYEIFKDELGGGFGVGKVYTDFDDPMSMKQKIIWEKCFDSTLCFFDPLARASHKGDGNYSGEIFPMFIEDFEVKFPDADINELEYMHDIEGFSWSYQDAQERKTIVVAEYYEKRKKSTKIVELANGSVMTLNKYKKMAKLWEERQIIEQIPIIVSRRTTELTTICHYKLIGSQILEYIETDYEYLPHVFFQGSTVNLTRGTSSTQAYQMTIPYFYYAKGTQDLKNFAGQTLCNYLQNQVQHKFIVMKEAIPQEKDYLAALTNPQRAATLIVNAYSENNPDKPIPNPIREVMNVPAPPEVMAAFQATDPTTQTILGSYASNLGQNDNDLSGKAVIESATVGNAAAMPYISGFLAGLNQMAIIHASLLPKYVLGKRNMPVMDKAGERDFQEVNTEGNPQLDYESGALHVCIEAGVNFQVQKNQALQQITSLMQASQEFAAFMNDDETLPILVDNLTVYGADRLKEAVPKWTQKKAQMQQQAMQMQQQQMMQDPAMIRAEAEMAKIKQKAEQDQVENQLAIAKLQIEKELAQAKLIEAEAKISESQVNQTIRLEEGETSRFNHSIDAATKIAEIEFKEHQKQLDHHHLDLEHRKLNEAKEKVNGNEIQT